RPLREVNPAVPEWLEELVAKLQAKKPADRIPSAGAVAAMLSRQLANLQSGTGLSTTQVGVVPPTPIGSPRRGKLVLWAGALALVLVVAAGGTWWITKNWPGGAGTADGGNSSGSKPTDGGNPGVQPGPAGAPPNRVTPSLLLNGL